jgi:ATP-dependent Clp endopeptidase proteolytic subunit ClpP
VSEASWYAIRDVTDKTAEVSIYDEIGLFGVTASEFSNSLKSLGNRRLTLRIHSPGGAIFEGNAIYNSLRRHKAGVDVAIDGLAASMATVIAMAGEKRSMAENAMFMIHNPWTMTFGESKDLRKEANLMDDLKEGIISAYAGRTGMDRDKLSQMMDDETWLNAAEAKELGFVTDITEPFNMKNSFERFDISRFPKRPSNFMSKKSEVKEEAAPEVKEVPAPEAKAEVPAIEVSAEAKAIMALTAENAAYKDEVVNLGQENALLKKANADLELQLAVEQSEKEEVKLHLAQVKAALQIAPAAVVPEIPQEPAKSLYEQYMALEGEEATAFYKAHEQELRRQIKKA